MRVADFLSHLHGVRHSSRGHLALCPSHADTNQSLSIREGEKGILVKCWAGCELSAIAHAVGLKISDLFFDAGLPRGQRPAPKTAHVNRRSLAFRFELAALDHRLRAEAILREAANVMVSGLTDDALGRLIDGSLGGRLRETLA